MKIITQEGKRPIKAWVDTKMNPQPLLQPDEPNIEESALQQLRNLAGLPFIHRNGVAVMPDVHAGIGATVGSVIATRGAVIPAAAGVDLGCGMNAVRTNLKATDLPESLAAMRSAIEALIPSGSGPRGEHAQIDFATSRETPIEDIDIASRRFAILQSNLRTRHGQKLCAESLQRKVRHQLGTLGGGNHFIEVCLDEKDDVWIMLHSGSRGIGNIIGKYFIERAREDMERYFVHLPDADLAYLPEDSDDFRDYMKAVQWAQDYALANRRVMMKQVIKAVRETVNVDAALKFKITDEGANCHHNYIAHENHFGENLYITRKGAVRAREGDKVIIPGSMGQRSYIARGKGHPESYCSCSHGAGRVMTRTAARNKFKVEDLIAQTAGVECRKDAAVLDEIPAAYKDIDQVMANQSDLVEIEHTLKQILCIKGA